MGADSSYVSDGDSNPPESASRKSTYGLTRYELRCILDPADVYSRSFPGETFRVIEEKGADQIRRMPHPPPRVVGLGQEGVET